jgi:hypothetical protein
LLRCGIRKFVRDGDGLDVVRSAVCGWLQKRPLRMYVGAVSLGRQLTLLPALLFCCAQYVQ